MTATIQGHHNHLTALFFRDNPGEMMPKENFWTSWCKGRLTEADTPNIRLGATPSGLSSANLHHPRVNHEPCLGFETIQDHSDTKYSFSVNS